MHIVLDLFQEPQRVDVGDDALARFEAIKPAVGFGRVLVDPRVLVENVDLRQVVPLADLKVVEVVRRRNFHRAGALFGVGVFIRNDGYLTSDEWQQHCLSDEIFITLVVGMHGNGCVTEHRLGPRRCDDDEFFRVVLQWILEVPKVAFGLHLDDLKVRDCRLELGIPVDETLVLVDEARVVEFDEYLDDSLRQPLVHGEAFTRPITRCAEPLELIKDGIATFLLPGPNLLNEPLAPNRLPVRLLALHHLALDHHLRGDAGVIGARLPEHILAAHTLEAAKHVLQRVIEGVPHVQRARHVGRRDDDAKGLSVLALGTAAFEGVRSFPLGMDARLDLGGLIGLVEHRVGSSRGKAVGRAVLRSPFPKCQRAHSSRAPTTACASCAIWDMGLGRRHPQIRPYRCLLRSSHYCRAHCATLLRRCAACSQRAIDATSDE